MKSLSEFLNKIKYTNYDKQIIISTALFVYFTKICWFGFCDEEAIIESSFSSFIFVLAFALVFSEYEWFPKKIKYPSRIAVLIFEIVTTMLATDLLLKLVWDPFSVAIHNMLKALAEYAINMNNSLYWESDSMLAYLAELLEEEFTHSLLLTIIAISCLYSVLDGLEVIGQLIDKFVCRTNDVSTSISESHASCLPCTSQLPHIRQNTRPRRRGRLYR